MRETSQPAASKHLIRVGIADDHCMVRQGIIALLRAQSSIRVVLEASNGAELIRKLQNDRTLPEVIIVDASMPQVDGFAVLKYLQSNLPNVRAIMLSMYDDDEHVKNAILAGATGYVVKGDAFTELLRAINIVYADGIYLGVAIDEHVFLSSGMHQTEMPVPDLTERERAILELMCSDLNYEKIAAKMFLSIKTVEACRHQLFTRFGVKSRAGLIVAAFAGGIIAIPRADKSSHLHMG